MGNININSPYALYYLITVMSHFGLLITAAFFGNAAYRDFKENTYGGGNFLLNRLLWTALAVILLIDKNTDDNIIYVTADKDK